MLAKVSERLRSWKEQGRKTRIVDVSSLDNARKVLLQGQNRRDIGNEVMPELGFRLTVWNGEESTGAEVMIQCGSYSTVKGLSNHCLLNLRQSLARTLGEESLRAILESMAEIWSPESASVYVLVPKRDDFVKRHLIEIKPGAKLSRDEKSIREYLA
jgi:hypothetical protein